MIESKYKDKYKDVMAEVAEAEQTMKAREEKLKEIDQAVREAKKASEKAVDEKMELKVGEKQSLSKIAALRMSSRMIFLFRHGPLHFAFLYLSVLLALLSLSSALVVTPQLLQSTSDPLDILQMLSEPLQPGSIPLSTTTRVSNLRRVNKSLMASANPKGQSNPDNSHYTAPLRSALDLLLPSLTQIPDPNTLPLQLLNSLPTFSRLLSNPPTSSLHSIINLYPPSFHKSIALASLTPHDVITVKHPTLPIEYHQNLFIDLDNDITEAVQGLPLEVSRGCWSELRRTRRWCDTLF